jgi:hypothetical protein
MTSNLAAVIGELGRLWYGITVGFHDVGLSRGEEPSESSRILRKDQPLRCWSDAS